MPQQLEEHKRKNLIYHLQHRGYQLRDRLKDMTKRAERSPNQEVLGRIITTNIELVQQIDDLIEIFSTSEIFYEKSE